MIKTNGFDKVLYDVSLMHLVSTLKSAHLFLT